MSESTAVSLPARNATSFPLDMVDRQGSHVDLLPVWRPGNCRVVGQISRLT